MLVCNLNNNRNRPLKWIVEAVYEWHLIHTDTFACTEPLFGCLEKISKSMKTNFGNNVNEQCPQGPPNK
jgi:hypothetical protein